MCLICQNKINDTVTKLKICPNVTETQLFELHFSGRLDNLQELDCQEHTGLQNLPPLPNLQNLYCWGCTGLQTLPLLPNLQILFCWGCIGLRTFPLLPNLQELVCEDCTSLQTIPLFPNLQELNFGELNFGSCFWAPPYYFLYRRTWTNEAFRKGMYALCQVWKTWNTRRKRIKAIQPLPKVLLEKIN